MSGLSCLPLKVYQFLFPFKSHFRCAQGRHFLLFCWLLVALILDTGKGTVKDLSRLLPSRLRYWALLRMLRSGQWDPQEILQEMVGPVLAYLPPPQDGVLHLIGDGSVKEKRGQKHPLGRLTRTNEWAAYCFGFEVVLLIASWDHYRVPVALGVVDPAIKGHQNLLFRQMLEQFQPPRWVTQVIVEADAGFAANPTFALLARLEYFYVFALARTRKFSDGRHLSDLVKHLPKSCYRRVASYKPDGRRRDYWVFTRRATLHKLGDVTILLSKRRRNMGPKSVKILVTNLQDASAGTILSCYARRWGIEVTFKELKGGLHLGQMQVTKEAGRVERSVFLPVFSYLLLLRLYGREATCAKEVSLFHLKHRFTTDVLHEQWQRSEQKWCRKFEQLKLAA